MAREYIRRRGIFDSRREPRASSLLGTLLTTKGDIATHDGSDPVRLGVGTDNFILQVDSTQAEGIKWFDLFGTENAWTAKQDFVATGIELGTIFDTNGDEELSFSSDSSPVNYLDIQNANTGQWPELRAAGEVTTGILLKDSNDNGMLRLNPVLGASNALLVTTSTAGSPIQMAPLGGTITDGLQFNDGNTNEILSLSSGGILSINYLGITSSTAGNPPILQSLGDDTDIDLDVQTTGIGRINLDAGIDLRTTSWATATANNEGLFLRWPSTSEFTVTAATGASVGILSALGKFIYNTSGVVAAGPNLFAASETIQPGKNAQQLHNIISFSGGPTLDASTFTGFRHQHSNADTANFSDAPVFTDASGGSFAILTDWFGFRSRMNLVDASVRLAERRGFTYNDVDGAGTTDTQTVILSEALSNSTVANRYLHFPATHPPTNVIDGSIHEPNIWFAGLTPSYGGGDGVVGIANATTAVSSDITGGVALWSENEELHIRSFNDAHNSIDVETGTFGVGANTMAILRHISGNTITIQNTASDFAALREGSPFTLSGAVTTLRNPKAVHYSSTITHGALTITTGTPIFHNEATFHNAIGAGLGGTINSGAGSFHDDPDFTSASASFPTANYEGFRSDVTVTSGTITSATGVLIADKTGAGTLTTRTGILVEDQTAATTNVGIQVDGADTYALWLGAGADNTGAADGITWGQSADCNLYRSAADHLTTDDTLIAVELTASGDIGGQAGDNTMTGTSSADVGGTTITLGGDNVPTSGAQAGWIKFFAGTTVAYVPYWT